MLKLPRVPEVRCIAIVNADRSVNYKAYRHLVSLLYRPYLTVKIENLHDVTS